MGDTYIWSAFTLLGAKFRLICSSMAAMALSSSLGFLFVEASPSYDTLRLVDIVGDSLRLL